MYAIVKTGGKQYKVAPGDIIEIEKVEGEAGDKVELDVICVVDGDAVEADPAKAAGTKVVAEVVEQFKGDKQLVFKFKKRKNYKRTKGHRQQLTRVRIVSVGSAEAEQDSKKAASKPEKEAPAAEEPKAVVEEAVEAKEAEVAEEAAVEEAETAETEEAPAAEEEAAEEAEQASEE